MEEHPPPLNLCIIIVCNFFWDMKMSKEKSKTKIMQNWGGGGGFEKVGNFCFGHVTHQIRLCFQPEEEMFNSTHFGHKGQSWS